jgi:hypothetical protein
MMLAAAGDAEQPNSLDLIFRHEQPNSLDLTFRHEPRIALSMAGRAGRHG